MDSDSDISENIYEGSPRPSDFRYPPNRRIGPGYDKHFPFHPDLEKSSIPRLFKSQLDPPATTLVNLDYPNRNAEGIELHQSFYEKSKFSSLPSTLKKGSAIDAISPDDLRNTFGFGSFALPKTKRVHVKAPKTNFNVVHYTTTPHSAPSEDPPNQTTNRSIRLTQATAEECLTFSSCTEHMGEDVAERCCPETKAAGDDQLRYGCIQNARFTPHVNFLDLTATTKCNIPMTHFFSFTPTHDYDDVLHSYAFHHMKRIFFAEDRIPFSFLEIGVAILHSDTHRSVEQLRLDLMNTHKNPYSYASQRNEATLTQRLGPPLPNASQRHAMAKWHQNVFANQLLSHMDIHAQPQPMHVADLGNFYSIFLVACTRLYKSLSQSVDLSVYLSRFAFCLVFKLCKGRQM